MNENDKQNEWFDADETENSDKITPPAKELASEDDPSKEVCERTQDAEEIAGESAEMPEPEQEDTQQAAEPEERVVYRWDYAKQVAADQSATDKRGRRGIVTYAIIMTACFAISFGILLATLMVGWGGSLAFGASSSGNGDRIVYIKDDYAGSGVLTEQEISTAGNQVVVAISVKTTLGSGIGTGFILTSDGYIATNSHVVNGATSITVTMYDGKQYTAELIGESEMDDLAVIKIHATGLPVAKLGDSSKALVGDRVVAIGHPAGLEFGWTSTYGRLSAINRDVKIRDNDGTMSKKMTLLQTDATVNSGNSGGPMFNEYGEVIGIVTMKLAGDYEGIGFAIPINSAKPLLEALMQKGNVDGVQSEVSSPRAVLGVSCVYVEKDWYCVFTETGIDHLTEQGAAVTEGSFQITATGALVSGTTEGTDAVGKVQRSDVIIAFNGKAIDNRDALREYLYDCNIGDTVTLTCDRGGEIFTVDITLVAPTK